MKRRWLYWPALLALALVAAVALAACGGDDDETTEPQNQAPPPAETEAEGGEAESGEAESEPAPSGEAAKSEKVDISDFTFEPDPVVVQVDGKVIWQNEDPEAHTATADDGSFDTGDIEPDNIKSETFKAAGSIPYHCEIHPFMKGTVEVVE